MSICLWWETLWNATYSIKNVEEISGTCVWSNSRQSWFQEDKYFPSSYGFSDSGFFSFKQLHQYFWKSLAPLRLWNSGLCGAALLSVGRVSPGTTGPTEYSKKDWMCFTCHNIIWNDLHTLLSFCQGIFVTKAIGKDSHLSCCNIKKLQQSCSCCCWVCKHMCLSFL